MFMFNVPARRLLPATIALLVAAANMGFSGSSYSETYEDRLVNCVEITGGKWQLKMSVPFAGDTSGLTAFSVATIVVGDVTFSAPLGNDCKFRQGVTKARLQQVVSLPGGGGALALDVTLSWAGNVLNATVRGFPPLSGSPVGDDLYNGAIIGAVNGNVAASVNLGGIIINSSTPVAGTATEKAKASCNSQFNLRRVKVGGAS